MDFTLTSTIRANYISRNRGGGGDLYVTLPYQKMQLLRFLSSDTNSSGYKYMVAYIQLLWAASYALDFTLWLPLAQLHCGPSGVMEQGWPKRTTNFSKQTCNHSGKTGLAWAAPNGDLLNLILPAAAAGRWQDFNRCLFWYSIFAKRGKARLALVRVGLWGNLTETCLILRKLYVFT